MSKRKASSKTETARKKLNTRMEVKLEENEIQDGNDNAPLQETSDIKQEKQGKINLRNLRVNTNSEKKPKISISNKDKLKAVVDLEQMKEELKQLEDPPITVLEKKLCASRLPFSFFDVPCETLAKQLLGKVLVRKLENGTILKGRIVETESYLGTIDKASHTYDNKVTPRNIPMYMPPGTIYIYITYGMYHCFNISSEGLGCAVLLRAVEPLEGIEFMAAERQKKSKSKSAAAKAKILQIHELCSGPSKLCMAFQLDRSHNKYSLSSWKNMWLENGDDEKDMKIITCPRIGVDCSGKEWASKPLRYYIYGSKSVSKIDKKAENTSK